jgi:LDH2 family malate/lactate/ureidoglycolate dehydrogenase
MNDNTTIGKMPTLIHAAALRTFCVRVFEKLNVASADAEITADVLVEANLRGVDSHGVDQLRRYVNGLQSGLMVPRPNEKTLRETATTALIDADAGLGQPASFRSMQRAIEKAEKSGIGFVTVRNSNHYGIAGYYAMMALQYDMIGISLTNANVSVVPTFGQRPMIGTNPISVAVPAGHQLPFVLDMATSTVAVGKITVAHRQGKPIPEGWAIDKTGAPVTDPGRVLDNRSQGRPGGVLPLGGVGELLGGHKGYGLAMLVEILSAVLPGAACLDATYPTAADGAPAPANLGHFFGAIRIDAFRPLTQFREEMDDVILRIKDSPKAAGADRIYIPGEKEFKEARHRSKNGIPLPAYTTTALQAIARTLRVTYDL